MPKFSLAHEWRQAWKWLSVQLGCLIAIAPAIYENLVFAQEFIPRPYFATVQAVLGVMVMLNAVNQKRPKR